MALQTKPETESVEEPARGPGTSGSQVLEQSRSALNLKIWRGDPGGGRLVDYEVPLEEGMVVLDAVLWVQSHVDGDLAVRWNCKAAKCGSCSAEINGFPRLMCKTRVTEYAQGITVRPMQAFPIVRDLVTDVGWNYEVNKAIPEFTPRREEATDPRPWRMQQEDVERIIEYRKCIECFLCQDVCHVLRNHHLQDRYYGPRWMIRIAGLEMHPKDTLDRTPLLHGKAGVGMCNITKCCQEVCPEHIHITDNAIIPLKERMADQYYDPMRVVMSKALPKRLRPKRKETPVSAPLYADTERRQVDRRHGDRRRPNP